MSSSVQRKAETHLRLVSEGDPVALPHDARADDSAPTVISKSPPLVQPISSNKDKITELARKPVSAESIVEGLHGQKLAHFELIEPIGVGGMAAVIRARDTLLDRNVALKILPPEMAQQPDNVLRFHQEAKAAAKLDHENIARVFYCGEDQGLHFIAFEFVEGLNLRAMLELKGRIPVREAVGYILQVATGLEHAASRGVVHRDVKPSNIIVTPDGRAKLVDMGLARNLERRGEADLTHSGMTLGTFDYISPEQALEPRDADARSDIYSLGCTFYHMLTGQSPTPEGTPAKKLHHHQHQQPLDPREIDPTIPAEIVMILGRMMAKNPRDRYQRPIHLVHHLVQVAQKLGVADDVPDGVLFVDAPLPAPVHSRPFMAIGLALAALVVVVLVLSLAPTNPVQPAKSILANPGPDAVSSKPNAKTPATAAKPDGPAAPIHAPGSVRTIDDLRAVLNDQQTTDIKAKLENSQPIYLDGTLFKGRRNQTLTLESDDWESVLAFQYKNDGPAIGLAVEGADEVVFRKITFEIEASRTPTEGAVAPVAVRGVKRVRFENCIFRQPNAPAIPAQTNGKRIPFASLLIDASEDSEHVRPEVIVKDCLFAGANDKGGQIAVAVNGPALIHVSDTAFMPHSAFFSFRDKCSRDLKQTMLIMDHSVGFIYTGPAFRFAKDASAEVRLNGNVFSGSKSVLVSNEGLAMPGLFYFAGDKPIAFEGHGNLYHWPYLFISRPGSMKTIATLEDYQKELAKMKCVDADATWIDTTSKATNPLANPGKLADAGIEAFQLKPQYAGNFGLRSYWAGKLAEAAGLAKTPTPELKVKIVDAKHDSTAPNTYRSLAAALAEAGDGETILLKDSDESREIAVTPISIKTGINLTIKPFDESTHPILVLDEGDLKKDLAMFSVQVGTLQLHNLEVRLAPTKSGREAQSVVHLGESAQCLFKNCVFTLKPASTAQLNVVAFSDLDMGMMMKSDVPNAIPKAEFRDCFVRGKGDLVKIRGCRPLQVEIDSSLIALNGQLLDVEANNKTMSVERPMMSVKVTRSSMFTTEPAFTLKSRSGNGLAKTDFKLDGCLFVGLSSDEPLLSLMLNDSREDKVDKIAEVLDWVGNKQNLYANFEKLREWKEQFPELNSDYDKLVFPKITDEIKQNLHEATPDLFRPLESEQSRLRGYGLPLTPEIEHRLLPTPDDEP